MATDPFPVLTSFLETLLLYLIFVGIMLSTISGVVAGILFLPVFGFNERRASLGGTALKLTLIGFLIIVLALPLRNAFLAHFPLPAGVPAVPLSTPVAQPSSTQIH